MSRLGTIGLLASLVAAPSVGLAAPAMALSAAQAKAQAAYRAGVAAFKAEQYAVALQHFELAYKLDPAPELLYNLARCHEMEGRAEEAVEHFELYLARVPKAQDRADVERRIKVMKAIVERERTTPAGEPAKATEPAPGPSTPGLRAEAPPPAAGSGALRWASYGLLGAGVAGLAAGGYFRAEATSLAEKHRGTADNTSKTSYANDAEDAQSSANLGFIAGGALLAVGAGLLVYDLVDEGASVSALPTPGGAGVVFSAPF